jgi:membrane associated rhomboid family serine protease
MIKKITLLSAIASTAIIGSGCATYGGYQPAVDTYSNPAAAGNLPQDRAECESIAKQAANTGMETAKGVGGGALLGAAAGAAIGAISGNAGKGAAIGAAAGGIGGGAYTGYDADNQYKRAYINCLRQRGHNVAN